MVLDVLPRIVAGSESLAGATTALSAVIAPAGGHAFVYGFYVHLHSVTRNDFVMEHSHRDTVFSGTDPEVVFRAAGGAATDIVAPNLPRITAPYPIDVEDIAAAMRRAKDARLAWSMFYLERGFRTAWIAPISAPWVGGYGALNHALAARHAPPPLPPDEMIPLAHAFHDAARKAGLTARHIGLTDRELATLQRLSHGRTTEEIATLDGITRQAVEHRMRRARGKLRARNTIEAMYKATVYGALPWRAPGA